MFSFLKNNKEPKNSKDVLKVLGALKGEVKTISEELEKLKHECAWALQKTGVVRFNPFSGVGGDQSFSIVLLNKKDDGVVITSLYARGGSRIYAKPIQNGTSKYSLSREEKEAISQATGPR